MYKGKDNLNVWRNIHCCNFVSGSLFSSTESRAVNDKIVKLYLVNFRVQIYGNTDHTNRKHGKQGRKGKETLNRVIFCWFSEFKSLAKSKKIPIYFCSYVWSIWMGNQKNTYQLCCGSIWVLTTCHTDKSSCWHWTDRAGSCFTDKSVAQYRESLCHSLHKTGMW